MIECKEINIESLAEQIKRESPCIGHLLYATAYNVPDYDYANRRSLLPNNLYWEWNFTYAYLILCAEGREHN
jgi:hypothetical protein